MVGARNAPVVARALEAYGGEPAWRAATAVEATVSCGGPLFRWKRGKGFRMLRIRAELAKPSVRMEPIDRRGSVGLLDGGDVSITTPEGAVVEQRADARQRFPYGRKLVRWDRLDGVYFFGYAMWNYLALPALLSRDDISWHELGPDTLQADFPPYLPTHCARQTFHFDPATGLLARLDYTAEVFGRWARAVHVIEEHRHDGGIPFPARRRVLPRSGNRAYPGAPSLIWIDIHGCRLS